uniref:Uncharacterized protein n=1 Tax=Haptolina ericina TaxID=156174 RepID=A0A7S3C5L0_9EUKA|mmetsp:Transcript_8172/g.18272  ORF Transcript_8172/g.18272 Transcript_8172/m.18272 type:complete len:196 (+) Transcript_8172:265-852(+)
MHANDRTFHTERPPASATAYYNLDEKGPTIGMGNKAPISPWRYVCMRSTSAGRTPKEGEGILGLKISTTEKVGPGSYSAHTIKVPPAEPQRKVPGSCVFASTRPRVGKEGMLPWRVAEPGFSSLAVDQRAWQQHENQMTKGNSFANTQRFRRPAGPGSNLPTQKIPPGPASYGKLHSWPAGGFKSSSRGFNHYGR